MKEKQLMKLFDLNPRYLIGASESSKWWMTFRDYKDWEYGECLEELQNVITKVGNDNPRFYYVQAVRRNMILKKNQEHKRSSMPKAIKELFK